MSIDPGVLSSITSLVDHDPTNVPLRLHLADLLLAAGQPVDALAHVATALAARPDDVLALSLAARAADAAGDSARAASYRRLADSLKHGQEHIVT